MRDKKKISNKIVQASKEMFYPGLARIALNLNRIKSLQGEELSIWREVEDIVEAMTDQPGQDSVYTEREAKKNSTSGISTFLTSLGRGNYWNPSKRILLPGYAISSFNRWARENPVRLRVWMDKKKIIAGVDPVTQTEPALLLLWTSYFQREGWKRLKRCPQCKKWFVDETKNRMKVHCSKQCKWQWWNREKRWEAGHKYQKKPKIRDVEKIDRKVIGPSEIVRLLYGRKG